MTKRNALLIPAFLLTAAIVAYSFRDERQGSFTLNPPQSEILADGQTSLVLLGTVHGRPLRPKKLKVAIVEGSNRASIESATGDARRVEVRIRPGILAGRVVVEVGAEGFTPSRKEFTTSVLKSDTWADGTPDFLRLNPDDEDAFRAWFTYLAEAQYYRPATRIPKEINDCAALIRFAFREALRTHDAQWANALDLDQATPLPAVGKYKYPYTPLGAALFRIREGSFRVENLKDGTYAEFADANTLQRFNTHFVSKDVRSARPGDLLFFRQLDQDMPFHAMIFVGQSHFEAGLGPHLVYHTGPIGKTDGEIRRPLVDALLHHPEPKWRPVSANNSFLGVYRWNILR